MSGAGFDLRVQVWGPGEELPEDVVALAYQVLYESLGQPWDGPWAPRVRDTDSHRVALYERDSDGNEQVVAHARIKRETCTVMTVAVSPAVQGRGIGRILMGEIERMCREWNAAEVTFDARTTAVGFYEKLGYEVTGGEFVRQPSGLPHFPMRKTLK